MGKYEPLRTFLLAQDRELIPMTFAEIESVIGSNLPNSKHFRAWWSNNPWNNVMTKEWLEAGYQTKSVDVEGEKLVFRQVRKAESVMKTGGFAETPQAAFDDGKVKPKHPGFGFMKGLIAFADDFDPTQPAFPDWDQYEEEKYGKNSKLHE